MSFSHSAKETQVAVELCPQPDSSSINDENEHEAINVAEKYIDTTKYSPFLVQSQEVMFTKAQCYL